jgi:hypothetical protein
MMDLQDRLREDGGRTQSDLGRGARRAAGIRPAQNRLPEKR